MPGFTKSLRGRFAAYFAISIIISLLVSGLLAGTLVQRYLREKTISDLQSQAQALAGQIESEGLPQGRYLVDLERMYQTRVIIAPYGDQTLRQLPQAGLRSDVAEPNSRSLPMLDWDLLASGGIQVLQTDLPGFERDVIVVAYGFKANDQLAGAVVLSKPLRLFQSWRPLAVELFIAAAIALVVSLILSFLLARRLSRPLHEITQAAAAVAEGDYSSELNVRSNDEIGRLADAFRYMTAEVRQAQEQQRQFVINVSHELKTPLTAIAGHSQALQDGIAKDPQSVDKSLGVIISETRRLSLLIEDLLSLAKFDARQFELKRTTVAVAEVIGQVTDSFSRDARERGIELVISGDLATGGAADADKAEAAGGPGRISVATDPDRLRQILSNLVLNALAHTPAGGRVMLSAQNVADKTSAAAAHLEIDVTDTGAGIAAEDLPHVFERFYRASSSSRDAGLGLGLAISRELARALGGDITVSSTSGKGSSFTISLPS